MSRRADRIDAATRKIALVAIAPAIGVSQACRLLDLSRDTYYRLAKTYRAGGFLGLVDAVHGVSEARCIAPDVEAAIIEVSEREPLLGKVKVAARISVAGRAVPPSAVAAVWKRLGMTLAEQRVERSRMARHSNAERATVEALLVEQQRLTSEVARLATLVAREPRKAPVRARGESKRTAVTAAGSGPSPGVELFRTLFGVAPAPVADRGPAVDAPLPVPPRVTSLLAPFFTADDGIAPSAQGDTPAALK